VNTRNHFDDLAGRRSDGVKKSDMLRKNHAGLGAPASLPASFRFLVSIHEPSWSALPGRRHPRDTIALSLT